jgi:UDP-3-O-acyl-N-acetylglucosamine deacetylase
MSATKTPPTPLDIQVGGDHYKKMTIQPVEYMHGNNIPFMEGCVIKYMTRWRDKGGLKDLEKARHFIDLLIELEAKAAAAAAAVKGARRVRT